MADQLSSDLASLRIDRSDTGGGPQQGRGGALKALVWVAVVGAVGFGVYSVAKPKLEAEFFKTEVDVTEISMVSPAQASIELSSTGYVVPQIVSLVGAKIPGRVAKIAVKEGDRVKAGDFLMELDSADYQAQKRAAETRVAAARARVQSAKASVAEIEVQLEREKRLVAENVSPKANAENLAARVAALQAAVAAAEAEVTAAVAEVRQADVNLGYLTITAPITGEIVSKPPQLGELVGALTLTPLTIEIADMSTLTVETDVPESRLELVKAKAPCEISLDAFPSKRFRGEVLEVSPKINRQKATVKVKVTFVDSTEGVLPEMAARVSFLQKALDADAMKEAPKLVVPAGAVVDRGGAKLVYVVESDHVKAVPVTLGPPFGGGFELVSGPSAGTHVVKDPPPTLGDGQKIKERGQG
ncbi:MAG TPA: efflux RND transporter periplasmic adaptor subunit [Polyangiaceae bacterium]|nr:efflux RND transporter periplasmic adaptor subunit [Polyangiaceae bacterium]